MSSVIDLKTSTSQLKSANMGVANLKYQQVLPAADATLNNFPGSSIHLRWDVSGTTWWHPQHSYLKLRCVMKDNTGQQLVTADQIGPAMNLASLLFQSAEMRLNGKTICRTNDFLSQVDTLEHRLSKSKSWFDSVGEATNFWQASLDSRIQQVSSDGKDSNTEAKDGRVSLGYDEATNQIEVAADTGVISFTANGGQALPNLAELFSIGDYIEIEAGAAANERFRIATVDGPNNTLTTDGKSRAIAAGGHPFYRIRSTPSRQLDAFEVCWQPLSLSIFKINHALPVGSYELVLNTQTSNAFRQRVVQSKGLDVVGKASSATTANTQFNFDVAQVYFYAATFESQRVDNLTYYLDLSNTRCQSEDVSTGAGLTQKQFDVSPSTYALTIAFQAGNAGGGSETRLSASQFKLRNSEEQKLNRFFIQYNGVSRPAPDADPSYKLTGAEDYMVQRYLDTQLHSGAYFDNGGSETMAEWLERGAYLHFKWPKDGSDTSTRVSVHYSINGGTTEANNRLLLFDHYYSYTTVVIKDGRVQSVESMDM